MKSRSRIVVPAVLGLTLVGALALPDGPPGVRASAAWSLRPLLAAMSPLRLLRLGDREDTTAADRWRQAYLQEVARGAEQRERLAARAELDRLEGHPVARETFEEHRALHLAARVFAYDASPLRHGILVDRGEEDGVVRGLPVTVGECLVGIVVRTWATSCQVRLLDDPQMRLRAAVAVAGAEGEPETLRTGNLEGQGAGRLAMRFVRGPGIEAEALVVTTAEDWWVPAFLVAGTVSRITDHDHDGVAEVLVEAATRLDGLTAVTIWRRPDPPPGPWSGDR